MATVYGANRNRPAAAPAAAPATTKGAAATYSTGLFKPRNENSKSIATVQVKEDVVIKAGSYINLYEADQKGETSPLFRMQVREGVLKSK